MKQNLCSLCFGLSKFNFSKKYVIIPMVNTVCIELCLCFVFSLVDQSFHRYFGSSYLEVGGIEPTTLFCITVKVQTKVAHGTIFYLDQGPNDGYFFMKLYLTGGILQVRDTIFIR